MARRNGRAPIAGSQPFSTRKSSAASVRSSWSSRSASEERMRRSSRSTIVLISSRVSLWKTITSSMRLRNSGRKTFLSSPMMRPFMSSYEIPVSSSDTAKPSGVLRAISPAPMFEVMITIACRKSTVRPCESVRRPSSRICRRMLKTSGWAFSISSSRSTEYGLRGTPPAGRPPPSLPPALGVADVAGRRADEARHRVLLHVLRHVDADHRLLVAEEELGERARQLGLADARRAEEDEGAGRPLRVLEARARAPDRLRDDLDRLVLADHALVQLVLHAHELLRLGLGELEHGDAGPHRDDVGDLLLADRGTLAALAGLPGVLELALAVRELALRVPQRCGLLELLRLERGLLLAPRRLDLLLELPVHGRGGHRLDAHARRGLVDQVDRLVGQEAVGDVAVGELGRGVQRLVGDLDAVVLLVAVAQALEDLLGLLDRRLVDLDLLEAALQGRVALEVLAVLVERGRAHGLQLAARQRRLEDRGGVDRALRGTRADEVVELVDEQDDVAALGDLLHHLLEALLELAAVLRARDQRRQVERVDLLVLEQLRHVAVRDALREALDDGGLADARLAHQHRVVLGAAREDLHDPLDLGLPAHDGVELAVGRQLGQIATELVQQLGRLLLALGAGAARRRLTLAPALRTPATGA